jgi:hypothetical protein
VIFGLFFRVFKQFLDFSGICFRIKSKFEKKTYPFPTGLSPEARPGLPAPAQPASRRSPSGLLPWPAHLCRRRQVFCLGVRTSSAWARVAIKGERPGPARALRAALARPPAAPAAARRRSTRACRAPPSAKPSPLPPGCRLCAMLRRRRVKSTPPLHKVEPSAASCFMSPCHHWNAAVYVPVRRSGGAATVVDSSHLTAAGRRCHHRMIRDVETHPRNPRPSPGMHRSTTGQWSPSRLSPPSPVVLLQKSGGLRLYPTQVSTST